MSAATSTAQPAPHAHDDLSNRGMLCTDESSIPAAPAHDESSSHAAPSADVRPGNLYFLAAGAWYTLVSMAQLAAGRADPQVNAGRMIRGLFTRHIDGALDGIHHESGHCYTCRVPKGLLSDAEAVSRLVLCEDGVAIGPAHASHSDIRALGGGRYSHWSGWLYFSTPDNTDPRTNGRVYTYRD